MTGQTPPDWDQLFASVNPKIAIASAQTFHRRWSSASKPIQVTCDDGLQYVVKAMLSGSNQGRMLFNDQIAARLGALIEAPVPNVRLVEISAAFIKSNPDPNSQAGHILPCVAHGSALIPNVTERENNIVPDGDNRARFASIAIFFGWLGGNDQQFIYEKRAPNRVYSHDHGHFFPRGPNWTRESLNSAPEAVADAKVCAAAKFTADELATACNPLRAVSPIQIAEILSIPPDDWGVNEVERKAMAVYLMKRKQDLASKY